MNGIKFTNCKKTFKLDKVGFASIIKKSFYPTQQFIKFKKLIFCYITNQNH